MSLDFMAAMPTWCIVWYNPSVVGAIIDVGFCLDLMDQEHIKVVKASYLSLMESYAMLNLTFPKNKNVGKSTDLLLR